MSALRGLAGLAVVVLLATSSFFVLEAFHAPITFSESRLVPASVTLTSSAGCSTSSGGGCSTSSISLPTLGFAVVLLEQGGRVSNAPTDQRGSTFANKSYCFSTTAFMSAIWSASTGASSGSETFIDHSPSTYSAMWVYVFGNTVASDTNQLPYIETTVACSSTFTNQTPTLNFPGLAANSYALADFPYSATQSEACSGVSGSTVHYFAPAGALLPDACFAYVTTGPPQTTLVQASLASGSASYAWQGSGVSVTLFELSSSTTPTACNSGNPDLGQTCSFALTFTGYTTPVTWTETRNGSASNITIGSGNTAKFKGYPESANTTYTIYLNATSHDGKTNAITITETFYLQYAALSPSPTPTQVGETSTLSFAFGDGVTPWTWTLTKNGSSSNLSGAGASSYVFTPVGAGTYTFYLNATDSNSEPAKKTATVVVNLALTTTLAYANHFVDSGQTDGISWSYAHGVSPVTWSLHKNGSASNLSGAGSGTSGTYTYTGFSTATANRPVTFYFNATDAVGSSVKKNVTVLVEPDPSAVLTAFPTSIKLRETSLLNYTISGGTSNYAWTLQKNGSASNLASGTNTGPATAYTFAPAGAGTYTFYFNSTDGYSLSAKATATVTVSNSFALWLNATPAAIDLGGYTNLSVAIAYGSSPWTWTLQENGSLRNLSEASSPYLFYPLHAATYTFYLNATDAKGTTAKTSVAVPVGPGLSVNFTYAPTPAEVGVILTFTSSVTGGVASFTYAWTFGDGGSSSATNPTHAYVSRGTFWTKLSVTDAHSVVVSVTHPVVVVQLKVSFTWTPTTLEANGPVVFVGNVSNGTSAYTYAWAFGDGGTSTAADPTHTFTSTTSRTVWLNVTDTLGAAASVSHLLTFNATPTVSFTANPNPTEANVTTAFSATVVHGVRPFDYEWTFGDSGRNSTASPKHAYRAPGNFTVTVNVTDADGVTVSSTVHLVAAAFLDATFVWSPAAPHPHNHVLLVSNVSGGVAPFSYRWFWPSVGTATGSAPTFVAPTNGTYIVTLNVTDHLGAVVREDEELIVSIPPPTSFNGTVNATATAPIPWDSLIFITFIVGGFWAVFVAVDWRIRRGKRRPVVFGPFSGGNNRQPSGRR